MVWLNMAARGGICICKKYTNSLIIGVGVDLLFSGAIRVKMLK